MSNSDGFRGTPQRRCDGPFFDPSAATHGLPQWVDSESAGGCPIYIRATHVAQGWVELAPRRGPLPPPSRPARQPAIVISWCSQRTHRFATAAAATLPGLPAAFSFRPNCDHRTS
jgi:hypothetical protein